MKIKKAFNIFLAIAVFFLGLFAIIMVAGAVAIMLSNFAIKIIGAEANDWKITITVIVSTFVIIMCIKPVGWGSKKWANWINSIC